MLGLEQGFGTKKSAQGLQPFDMTSPFRDWASNTTSGMNLNGCGKEYNPDLIQWFVEWRGERNKSRPNISSMANWTLLRTAYYIARREMLGDNLCLGSINKIQFSVPFSEWWFKKPTAAKVEEYVLVGVLMIVAHTIFVSRTEFHCSLPGCQWPEARAPDRPSQQPYYQNFS